MNTYIEFKNSLTDEIKTKLVKHFNETYEVLELSEHEIKITYLAYLYKNGQVDTDNGAVEIIDEKKLGISSNDYELTIEVDEPAGFNFYIMYDFYYFDDLLALLTNEGY
jgi:hypothetical protein